MLGKCAVENAGAAARCTDNKYGAIYWLGHYKCILYLDFLFAFLELYDIFIKYLQQMNAGSEPV